MFLPFFNDYPRDLSAKRSVDTKSQNLARHLSTLGGIPSLKMMNNDGDGMLGGLESCVEVKNQQNHSRITSLSLTRTL